jgi:thioesterase domain-containing protein/NAD(P)-dependent dehydrogenase (short-subunit alcohol dehydrogenase family)/acyl carrier protein
VSGSWMTPEQATDPRAWVQQLRRTVRFHESVEQMFAGQEPILLEVGPGATLSALASQPGEGKPARVALTSLSPRSDPSADLATIHSSLGDLWTRGAAIDWQKFHAHEHRRRLPLPTYPFDKQRFWIGPRFGLDAATSDADSYFYQFAWTRTARPPAAVDVAPWLVLVGSENLGSEIVEDLRKHGAQVTAVFLGKSFEQTGADSFVVDPSSATDFDVLFSRLTEHQIPRKIVCLWPLETSTSGEQALDLSFYALLSLIQSLTGRSPDEAADIGVISHRLVSVQGEPVLHPELATLAGICRVAPREYPNLHCVHIDVDNASVEGLARRLIVELSGNIFDAVVAYREGERWAESIEPYRPQPGPSLVRNQGVYMITGGLGDLGLAVAEWLARSHKARLVLVSRDADSRKQDRSAELATLRQAGSEILVCAADVGDRDAMGRVFALARERFGTIHGIFHAAGVLDDTIIQLKTRAAAERVLSPKIEGTRVLSELAQDTPLDFLVLFSSISSVNPAPGQVDYCAANAYLNAFALSRPAGEHVFAIDWGAWSEIGMAVRTDRARRGRNVTVHPSLKRQESQTDSETAFSGILSVEHDWVLREHRFRDGDSLLPGTFSLDLAMAAAKPEIGDQALALEDCTFMEPFRVSPNHPREFQIALKRSGTAFDFSLTSSAITFSRGRVGPAPERPRKIDLEVIALRCSASEVAAPLNVRQDQHFDFGPRWRSIRHIRFGRDECLALLELAPEFRSELTEFSLHPALLDMATGAALFLLPGYDAPGDLFLPVSYRRAAVYQSLSGRIYSHARLRPALSPELSVFDITIVDEDGSVLMEIAEFVVKRLNNQQALSMRTSPLAESVEARPTPSSSAASGKVGISTNQGIDALRRILESRLRSVILVSPTPLNLKTAENVPRKAPLEIRVRIPGDTEGILEAIWQHALGLNSIERDADFFDLGGHSLTALRVFSEIRQQFGVDLGLATVYEARTIRALARLIDGLRHDVPRRGDFQCLVPIKSGGSKTPLFLVHGVGGNILSYQALVQHLQPDQPVYGLQALGLAGAVPHSTVEQMAAHYIPEILRVQPEGPYVIGGQSFGGLVAYEIGRQLEAQGKTVGFIGLIDTFQKRIPEVNDFPSLLNRLHSYMDRVELHGKKILFGPGRISYLKAQARTRKRKISGFFYRRRHRQFERKGVEIPAAFQDVDQSNRLAARRYTPGILHGSAVLFRCKIRSAGEDPDYWMGWKPVVRGNLHAVEVPGNHLSMMTEPNVEILADQLTAYMEKYALSLGSTPGTRSQNPADVAPLPN